LTDGANLVFGAGPGQLDVGKSGVTIANTSYAAVVGLLDPAAAAGSGNIVSGAAYAGSGVSAGSVGYRRIAVVDNGGGGITARYAAGGDADLDGAVTFTDLTVNMAAWTGPPIPGVWSTGDFDYDGFVTFTDLTGAMIADTGWTGAPITYSAVPAGITGDGLADLIVFADGSAILDPDGGPAIFPSFQIQSAGTNGIITAVGDGDGYLNPGLPVIMVGAPLTNSTVDEYANGFGAAIAAPAPIGVMFNLAAIAGDSKTLDLAFLMNDLQFTGQPVSVIYVPEPGTFGMLVLGLLSGLFIVRRRRQG
jgi:hypothetical protein